MSNETKRDHGHTKQNEHDGDGDGDAIRVTRPSWMPRETWANIKTAAAAHTDELVSTALAGEGVRRAVAQAPDFGCTERTWCVMGPTEDHLDYHSGNPTDMAEAHHPIDDDDGPHTGWQGWLTEDRGPAAEPRVKLKGVFQGKEGGEWTTTVDAVQAWDILKATATPQAHSDLLSMVETAIGES